jgi:acetyl-CoA carboxylase carboxyltransferase component
LVMLVEGSGARINERMGSGTIKGHERFSDLSLLSGWAPVVAGVSGRAFAGHANLIALSDFCVMTKGSSAGLAGPRLVEMATGERLTPEEIGDSTEHAGRLGSVELEVDDDEAMLAAIREYLSYLPTNCRTPSPRHPAPAEDDRLPDSVLTLVPDAPNRAYDMRRLVRMVLDNGQYMELKPTHARNVITCLGRLGGAPVGVVANNPMFLAGAIDTPGSHKMARFINLCDCFELPLVFLADVPGYLVGKASESSGIVRASMRPLWELGQATVPILTVVVRKAFGLAYHTMGGAEFHPELLVCWPGAQISPMGAEGAANVILGSRESVDPERFAALVAEFKRLEDPVRSAESAKIDDVIDPRDTRQALRSKLDFLQRTTYDSGHWRPPKKRGIAPI